MLSRIFLILGASFILSACSQKPPTPDVTYYLVRHAEKTVEKPDPALTETGEIRAQALAMRLSETPLTAIYSSDYTRTRETARPTAEAQNLSVQIYNPGDLSGFAESLAGETGHVLIVGHSNTTPQLAELLGGEAGEPIIEETEYDRFYVITKAGDRAESKIERYGN